jgi:hypothetical protein
MNTTRLLATLEAYPDQPKAPTLNEVRHALLVVCQLLALTLWGVGKTAHTMGQWAGYYYHHHETVDAKVHHQYQVVRYTLQYTAVFVFEDVREVVNLLLGQPECGLSKAYMTSFKWLCQAKVTPRLKTVRDVSESVRESCCTYINTSRESIKCWAIATHTHIADYYDRALLAELDKPTPSPWYVLQLFDVTRFVLDTLTRLC